MVIYHILFLLERAWQGDPLSSYLFIPVLELLSAALKNNPQVSGVAINGSEYLLSQYADDSALILGDEHNSFGEALNIFDCFFVYAGLRVSLDKTEAISVGSRLGSDDKLLPKKHLVWNTSGQFKLLEIHFNLSKEDKVSKIMVKKYKR